MNPQALNRYSYCVNNPLRYVDPTGHKFSLKGFVNGVKQAAQFVVNNIDTIQTVLDVAGMIPVAGEAFDCVNGVIYAARGDYINAGLSFAACVPIAGSVATGAKLAIKTVDKVSDAVKAVDKVEDITDDIRLIEKRVHGNTANDSWATLYGKVDKDGNLLKWGVTKDLDTRYTYVELNGGKLVTVESGPRREMLKKERDLVEIFPGPENHEAWAGAWLKWY
jgi:hypothetical protein